MTTKEEREVLKEFIKVYQDNPCLWDMTTDMYRDKSVKQAAWGKLTRVLKKLDPDANYDSTKKKVDNLRSAFYRELRKVRASELRATDKSEVQVPSLWYYKLMTFLDSKDWGPGRRAADPLVQYHVKQAATSDEESVESAELLVLEPEKPLKRKPYSSFQGSTRKAKRKEPIIQSIHTYAKPVNYESSFQEEKKPNYFGIYVGEQLDQVPTFQRHIAERLISEVLFLAKTDNLSYDSKIEKGSQEYDVSLSPRRMEIEVENEEETPRTLLKDLLTDGRRSSSIE